MGSKRAIRCVRNTEAEPRVLVEPPQQEFGSDCLSETGCAWYELAHRLDRPGDRRGHGPGRWPAPALRDAHAAQEAQREARWRHPERGPNADDGRERGQKKAVLTRREL